MAEEDKDESPHMDMDETDEEAQDIGPAFDDNLDSEVDNFTIEEDDRVFMAMVHPVNPHHFVHASSTVSGHLAEVFVKNSNLKSFEDTVPTSLHTYADVFSETAFDSLPERCKWDHTIELEREPSPEFHKVYPMTLTEQTEMDAFLEEALATGHIRQSKSPQSPSLLHQEERWEAPLHPGLLSSECDHQEESVSAPTHRQPYPSAQGRALLYQARRPLGNNVRIHEGDKWKATFRTNRGLFKPLVMYFGLTNSPATFQTMMNEIFQDLITEGIVSVYLDNILIFTN
jgi:hypothetical protein